MLAAVQLDDDLVRKAQELTGITDLSTLIREALKALFHLGASHRPAAPTNPDSPLNPIQ